MKFAAIISFVVILFLAACALLVAPFLSPIPEPDDEHGRR